MAWITTPKQKSYKIYTPIFCVGEKHIEWKILEKRIQNSLIKKIVPETKTVGCQNRISSFRNLIGQSSHVPVSSTTSASSESQRNSSRAKISLAFEPDHMTWKPISRFWKQLTLAILVFSFSLTSRPQTSLPPSVRHATEIGRTHNQWKYVHRHFRISIFTIIQTTQLFVDFNVASSIQINTPLLCNV